MDISVRGLTDGLHRHSQQVDVDEWNLPEEECITGPVQIDYTLEKIGEQIIIRGRVSTPVKMACSRCLETVRIDICEPFTLLVRFQGGHLCGQNRTGEIMDGEDDEEVKVVPPDTDSIDITEELRQTLLLSLPVKPLCSENCRGLCPQCGTNLNRGSCDCRRKKIDPRWAGLEKALKTSPQD